MFHMQPLSARKRSLQRYSAIRATLLRYRASCLHTNVHQYLLTTDTFPMSPLFSAKYIALWFGLA